MEKSLNNEHSPSSSSELSCSVKEPRLIVVASEGLDVSSHKDYCTNYNYYPVANHCLFDSQNLPAKGVIDEHYAEIFARFGVDVLITGEMRDDAARCFLNRGICVIRHAKGRAIEAAQAFLNGELMPDIR